MLTNRLWLLRIVLIIFFIACDIRVNATSDEVVSACATWSVVFSDALIATKAWEGDTVAQEDSRARRRTSWLQDFRAAEVQRAAKARHRA